MIGNKEVNPLNIFGLRRVSHCPPHFEQVMFDSRVQSSVLLNWIYDNLDGRFYMGNHAAKDQTGAAHMQTIIAFEKHSEASYFALCLNTLGK